MLPRSGRGVRDNVMKFHREDFEESHSIDLPVSSLPFTDFQPVEGSVSRSELSPLSSALLSPLSPFPLEQWS